MEAEYEVLTVASAEKAANSCEEILLPAMSSVTNGASAAGAPTNIEYLDENDPMGDFNDIDSKPRQQDVGEEDEENEEIEALDDELEEDGEGDDEEDEAPVERKPTQVPKKRRDAAILAAAAADNEDDEQEEILEEEEDDANNTEEPEPIAAKAASTKKIKEEKPTSSARAAANNENTVDEEQCRVCTTKVSLMSLFKKVQQHTVAEMLMTICPTVSIARKDFMPQYICSSCLENVTISVQLKTQCENTDRELRKKLSRGKNKVRRPAGYVVIDAPAESDPPSEEEPNDDVEFKVSDVEVSVSAEDDSDDSDFGAKKKRVGRGGGRGGGGTRGSGGTRGGSSTRGGYGRRGRRKSAAVTPTPKVKEKKRIGRPPTKRLALRSKDDSEEEMVEKVSPPQKKKKQAVESDKESPDKPKEFPCDECDQVFARKLSLVLHKKVHSGTREPINCKICGKQFKIQGAYRTHLAKHRDEPSAHHCEKCSKVFVNKTELRRHMLDEHGEQAMVHICNKCKRTFVSETRLARHQDGRCPGPQMKQKKPEIEGLAVGKDLFKSVAPLTTTYWSDSFSD